MTKAALIFNAAKIPLEFFTKLCESYDPEEIFKNKSILHELGLRDSQRERIESLLEKDSWAEHELELAEKNNARFIHAYDLDYPVRLKDLKRPPIGLYVKGNANLSLPSVAVVGTREPSDYGLNIARELGRKIAQIGMLTISGGAKGIDAECHRGTLEENGTTIAVFGTGIDKTYPSEHKDLFNRILEKGALISEYPMSTSGEAWHFPYRNRIIAALSTRIVVVESPLGGGALNTAEHSFKIERDVYVIPGRVTDEVCKGSNELMSRQGKILFDIDEFIKEVAYKHTQLNFGFDKDNSANIKTEESKTPELDDDERTVYSIIQKHKEITVDNLAEECDLDFMTIQTALLNLVSEGLVSEKAGRYSGRS